MFILVELVNDNYKSKCKLWVACNAFPAARDLHVISFAQAHEQSRRHLEGSRNWDWKFMFSLGIVTVVPSGAASVPPNI